MNEDVSRKAGFVADLNLECTKCNQTTAIMTSTSVTERGTSWDVNRRAVYHSVETGGGYEGLASFCSIMNMPCMTKTAYYKQESACWSIHKTGMPYKGQKSRKIEQHLRTQREEALRAAEGPTYEAGAF